MKYSLGVDNNLAVTKRKHLVSTSFKVTVLRRTFGVKSHVPLQVTFKVLGLHAAAF